MEQWRAVVGFEGAYEVSDMGCVRSLDRTEEYERVDQYSGRMLVVRRLHRGRVLRPGRKPSGHVSVALGRTSGSHDVHVLVLTAFVGLCPSGKEALHGDGDPANNKLENLRWGTRSENILEDIKRGVRNQQYGWSL